MWLEPQPSAIIGGAAIAEPSTTLVKAIDELVRKPSPIGAMVQSQASPSTTVPPGIMVNGGVWASINLSPIALFTLPAIPIHLSISDTEVRVGHYGSFHSETFHLKDARRLTVVEAYRPKERSFHAAEDVLIDFADGRRLRGNAVGDGGTSVRKDVMQLLIAKTGLTPEHASTADEVPPFRAGK
jgi:hypothetical protein